MTLPSFVDIRTMSSSWSLPVAGGDGHQVAGRGGLDRDDHDVGRLAALGREVAAVVGRTLLVAERLEPILQVLVELLVELLGLEPERFFVGALAAADDGLAQREEELPQPFLAPPRFDELERRVAEVVGEPAVGELHALEIAHRRDDVGDRRVADRHQVERLPVAGHVVGQAFVDPERQAAAEQRARE